MEKSFVGQHENEEVLMVFRKHPIAMRKGFYVLLIPFVLGALPYLIWSNNLNLLWLALGGFILGLLGFAYYFVCWYFSVFIVTTQRIRHILQHGLFKRSISDTDLDKISNLSVEMPGLSGSLLGFGTIVLQTFAGSMVLHKLRDPEETYNQLLHIVNEYGGGKEAAQNNAINAANTKDENDEEED